jgi:hypothetical protein
MRCGCQYRQLLRRRPSHTTEPSKANGAYSLCAPCSALVASLAMGIWVAGAAEGRATTCCKATAEAVRRTLVTRHVLLEECLHAQGDALASSHPPFSKRTFSISPLSNQDRLALYRPMWEVVRVGEDVRLGERAFLGGFTEG